MSVRYPLTENESQRVQALRELNALDTLPELAFDHLTELAAEICEAPLAFITLIDTDRQWIKSRVGVEVVQTSRDVAFCAHAICQPDLFIVPDALADDRFSENPMVM